MNEQLQLVIRTPHAIVVDELVSAARMPSESGQVGLRPRQAPFALVVEPGLCLLRTSAGVRFAATAGGLLDAARTSAVLYTPFAVVGDQGEAVLAALDQALALPDSELVARRRLGELEQHIVQELRHRPAVSRTRETQA